jgi:hypothetical protein
MLALLLALQLGTDAVPPPAHCVFYRESGFSGSGLHASIRVDGARPLHKLGAGRYWPVDLPPGEHLIYADRLQHAHTYQLAPGATYYFRVEFHYGPPPTPFGKLVFQIVAVDLDTATHEMQPLRTE